MSEQETRGANEAIDFNDELRNRREKLAALRQQGVAFPTIFAATIPLTSCTKSLMRRITRNWNP